jgi:hypothetical protein
MVEWAFFPSLTGMPILTSSLGRRLEALDLQSPRTRMSTARVSLGVIHTPHQKAIHRPWPCNVARGVEMLWRRKHPVRWGPGLQNAVHLCRFPGNVKQMLLSHQTGLVLYVRTGELQKEDVVRILYGASLPAIPRKRHGRVHLERGDAYVQRITKE